MTDKKKTLSEDDAYSIALEDHPDYMRALEKGDLPEEIIGEDGEPMSPRLHLTVHSMVEQQIANDEPAGVAEVARQLEQSGVDHHEIRHLIGGPLVEELFRTMKYGKAFDEKRYMRNLRKVVDEYRNEPA